MRYTERAITVVAIIAVIWGIREFIGSKVDREALLLAVLPLLLGTVISLFMTKAEFERTNSSGVELYRSFWHSSFWTVARFLNTIFLIGGGLIAVIAVFSV